MISKDSSYRENLNQYDVIKINMQEFLSLSGRIEEMLEMLRDYLFLDSILWYNISIKKRCNTS